MQRLGACAVFAAAGVLAAACASAPPDGPPGGPGGPGAGPGRLQEAKVARPVTILFTGMDANRDLVVTRDELDAAIETEFARADVDRSGVITGFEMMDWSRAALGDAEALPDLRAMDSDLNYTVTTAEFATALRREFDRLDTNGDKALVRAELLMVAPMRMQGGPGGGDRLPGPPPGGRRGGGRGGPPGGGGGSPPF